jgi:hypothetical protein
LAFTFAGNAERLARARSCPQRPIVRPSRETRSERPPADASEEMDLSKSDQVGGGDISDAATVDNSRRDVPRSDKVFEPIRSVIVNLIVKCHHD